MKIPFMSNIYKILNSGCTRRVGTTIALSIIAIFFILSLIRDYPYKNFESILNADHDDWSRYAGNALDIKHNGLFMPSTKNAYVSPAGFLYNYFIALFLAVFGEKSLPIFIAQHLMLGISAALVYWTFRDKMGNFLGMLLLVALFIFAIKDVYKNYSPLLLSENLALFTVSLFFFCFVKGFKDDIFALQLMSAVFMGLSVLSRPNIVICGIAMIFPAAFYYFKKRKARIIKLSMFVFVLVLSMSFLAVRNYVVCKKIFFLPRQVSFIYFAQLYHEIPPSVDLSGVDTHLLHTKLHLDKQMVGYIEYVRQKPFVFFGHYFKKILFCLGYIPILDPDNAPRPHWMIMWAGYFAYLILHIMRREKFDTWETGVHLFIFCYYATLILSGPIQNYGYRMLIPAINFALPFSFIFLEKIFNQLFITKAGGAI